MAIPEYLREIANARIEASQRGKLVGWVFDVEEGNGGLVPFDSTYKAVFDKRIEVVCFGCDGDTYGGLSLLRLSRQNDYSHAVLAEEKAREHGKMHAQKGEQWFIVRIFG
ncbi:hypothetical protein A2614_00260 [Candidatus Woesebacteria bacterium RIFOXYD1_FULL_40_21]|uniref:Uncharacterized protein n=1 Tax=Candidatus Woesebacteria bacterium RIFOXYD1_FULL_40_21 TaxID=1802549 RepID=A0A1F8DG52_9BACT|nr:MAG: hypothetical protein A2614_00260 [Candidatus Woesebacteria bacterium RIFOXYD1_FULL_40_21]